METKITTLDKPKIKYIRKRMETVLKPLAQELGVTIDVCNCSYQQSNCKFQVKLAVMDSAGNAVTEEIDFFRESAKLFGLEASDMGKEFTYRGSIYTICGLNPKSRKYHIIAKGANGNRYKFPCRIVLKALGRHVPDWLPD
jgi:hypothetical protein